MNNNTDQDLNSPAGKPMPRETEKWAARLALVNEIARSAHAKLEMSELLNSVAEAIHRHFEYYDVSMFLVDSEAAECVLVAQAGAFEAQGVEGYRQKLGTGLVGWVAEHGETIMANDTRLEPRHIVAFAGEEKFLSELVVPIRLAGKTEGVINVEKREANAFDESDVMTLEALSEQISQAIANAQLFERTRVLRDLNRSIIDAMPSGLCVLNGQLNVLYANPSFCALFGHDVEKINGKPVREVLSDKLLLKVDIESALQRALRENKMELFTNVDAGRDERKLILNIRVAPAQMPEGASVLIVFEDITQWRLAMGLAEERRSRLNMIVSHVPVAVISFGLDDRLMYWHTGARHLFGHADDEVIGKVNASELFAKEPSFSSLVKECATSDSAEAELFARRKDGSEIPVHVVLGKLRNRSEQHVGYTGVVVDITERHRAREELLREKLKLDSVVNVVGAGLTLIDRNHQIIWANPTIKQWFCKGNIEGKHCYEVYCRRDRKCHVCPAEECFATGRDSEAELALVRQDGALRQYHNAVSPVIGPSGEVEQVLKLTLDVTDQTKKVYELSRLRQLGELMRGMLDLDRLLHFILTCVTAGQALGFNRAVLMLLDRGREVIEGKIGVGPASAEEAGRIWNEITEVAPTLQDLLDQYDQAEQDKLSTMGHIAQSIHVSLSDTSHIITKCALSKRTIVVTDAENDPRVPRDFQQALGSSQFVLVPLIVRNQPVGVIMADNLYSGHPITEEHVELLRMFANQAAIAIENAENYEHLEEEKTHLEKAYRDLADAQEKLVSSERLVAIGRMAAHVAHEIRNPLVTIGGFADIIRNRPDASPDEIIRYSRTISSEVRRLENILSRVMDFTKPTRPILRQMAIQPVISDTVEQLRSQAKQQNVEIQIALSEPGTDLFIDPEQIKQVLLNIFHNALDTMEDGGRLSVRTEADSSRFTIVVGNTGELIKPEDMPNLFEPFFSTKLGGTGLGLAVSQKIIQEHGGDISVTSSLARGTEFMISLPFRFQRSDTPSDLTP